MVHLRNTLAGAAALSALMTTAVQAQDSNVAAATSAAPAVSSAPVAGVSAVPLWPATIDPVTASPAARAQYAIPPAPDAKAAPKAYAQWRKAMSGPRVAGKGILTHTTIKNGPVQRAGSATPNLNSGVYGISSYNWSGSADYLITNLANIEAIYTYFVVPQAHQRYGYCTGGWDYSSIWPGIDGFYASADVLQGGVEVDSLCFNGNMSQSFYSAWVEWYPNYETRVSYPEVHPGDEVFVQVWNTSATNGYVYIYNVSTNAAGQYQLTAPAGTMLSGNTVEWVVERPSVGGSLATLTNYTDVPLYSGFAWNYSVSSPTYYNPYSSPPSGGGALFLVQMVDNGGSGISYGNPRDQYDLWFQNYGTSRF
jgi:Peptidase A4 family